MTVELRTLRVSAEMDASKYTAGATSLNAANASMIASGKSVAVVLADTASKVSSAGDPVARLSRQFVDGFGASQKFDAGLRSLNRMLEQGKIDASQAATIYSGMTTKLGLVANGTNIASQGYAKLGAVVDTVNAELGAQVVAANSATASLTRLNAAANQNSLRGAGNFNTGNIAAQFQDIGVTSAMGMSPLQIALQQGTQLSAVFEQLKSSGQGVGAALAGAFTSIISPVSLLTIGLVGLSAVAIQYFSKLLSDSADSAEALKEQAELIDRVASRWGDALPALQAYNDEIGRQKDVQDALAAAAAAGSQLFAGTREAVKDINIDITDLVRQLETIGADTSQIVMLQNAFNDLQAKVADSTATGEDARRVQGELASLLVTGLPAVAAYSDRFGDLANQLDVVSASHARLSDEVENLNKMLGGLPRSLGGAGGPGDIGVMLERQRAEEENKRQGAIAPTPTPKPNMEDWGAEEDRRLDAEAKRAAAESKRAATEAAKVDPSERILRGQQERIELLRLEMSIMGQSEAVRARMISQLQVEQEIIRLGNDLKASEADAIRANAAAITEYSIRLKEVAEAQQDFNDRAEFFGGLGMDLFEGMTRGADGFKDALKRVVDQLLQAVLQATLMGQGPLAKLFGVAPTGGSSVGGLFGSLFSGLLGGGTSAFSFAPGAGLWDSGGFTGQGGKYQPAGVVHRGEFVFDQAATDRIGVVTLEAMRKGLPGYASGGVVQGQVRDYFSKKGLAEHQVAGVLGNVQAESNFNPAAVGDGGHAFGLFQWNDRGPAMKRYVGSDWRTDIKGQLDFAWHELQTTERRALRALLGADTVDEAVHAFLGFERPSGFNWNKPGSGHAYSKRLAAAIKFAKDVGAAFSPAKIAALTRTALDLDTDMRLDLTTTGGNMVEMGLDGTRYVTNKYGVTTAIYPGGGQAISRRPGVINPGIGNRFQTVDTSKINIPGYNFGQTTQFAKPQGGMAFPDAPSGANRNRGGGGYSYDSDRGRGMSPGASREIEAGRGGLYHEGGIAGFPSSYRSAGRGMMPDEVPAILRRGEPVFKSLEHARQVVGGGNSVVINQTIEDHVGVKVRNEQSRGADGSIEIRTIIEQVTAKSAGSRGNPLNNVLRKKMGAQQSLVSR